MLAQEIMNSDGEAIYGVLSTVAHDENLRAARANRVFCTDEKHIRTENTVMDKKTRAVWGGFHKRSSIGRGCAFHPCPIDDPRGRAAVRASLITAARCVVPRRSMPT